MSAPTTRERLIAAGYELFSRQGFHNVGLDRILDEVGVSKQTFYNHFESRDELIVEVIKRQDETELATMERKVTELAGDDPRARLLAVFDSLDLWMNEPDFRGCLFMTASVEFPSPHDPANKAAANHVHALRASLKADAQRAGAEDPAGVAEQLMILIQGAVLMRQSVGKLDASTIAGRMAERLLDRVLPQEPVIAAHSKP